MTEFFLFYHFIQILKYLEVNPSSNSRLFKFTAFKLDQRVIFKLDHHTPLSEANIKRASSALRLSLNCEANIWNISDDLWNMRPTTRVEE